MMHVNNETGVIQPVAELASLVEHDGLACALHVDAAQGFGKELAPLRHQRIDFISISGHKIGAPKGGGALIARRRNRDDRPALAPLAFGGGQELGLRPGTLAVPLIAGLGLAAELAAAECDSRHARCRAFREQVIAGLAPLQPVVNGDPARTLPNILNLTIPGIESDAAIEAWADLAAISNGAACTSQSYTCSHVLSAMGIGSRRAEGALRLSWSHDSTLPDLAAMVDAINVMRAAGDRGVAAAAATATRVQVA
jgi:cysteine desulfurase